MNSQKGNLWNFSRKTNKKRIIEQSTIIYELAITFLGELNQLLSFARKKNQLQRHPLPNLQSSEASNGVIPWCTATARRTRAVRKSSAALAVVLSWNGGRAHGANSPDSSPTWELMGEAWAWAICRCHVVDEAVQLPISCRATTLCSTSLHMTP